MLGDGVMSRSEVLVTVRHCWLLTAGCSLLAAHYWLLTIGLLTIGCSLLAAHYWLLTVRYSDCAAVGVQSTHRPIFLWGVAPLDPA